ncbi:MAG: transpeptidase family protein [Bacteroidales bacterium]|nr:transpeptidase family protein [Bacteroidales bacterium]MBN2761831.1 transpeptidase family protein [Bacteroidales bacterium]
MSIKRDILWRVGIVYFGFLLLGFLIIGKILYVQLFEKSRWEAEANAYILKNMIIPADRGSIYASDGRLLASSLPYYEIRFDARSTALTDKTFYEGIDSLAICLSRLFKDKPVWQYKNELIKARKQGRRYHLVKSGVNFIQLKELKTFPVFREGKYKGGFIYLQKNRRIRPHQNLAARLIGYTTKGDGGNVVGIEGAYDDQLNGVEGIRLMQRLSGDIWMPVNDRNEIEPRDGVDVITTIDIDVQDVAEKALLEQLTVQDARHGTAILMEVQTGEIKAMVNLSKDSQGRYRELQNFAIGESTEPGSTFKLPVLMAALEDGYIDLNDTIDTGDGTFQYYDKVIRDEQSKHGGYRELTVKQVFEYSSNVGMAKIITGAYKDQPHHFVDRLYRMRLNECLGIEIKGEGKPVIRYPGEKLWSGISLAQMSYGYEVRLTPLQILAFYNAIANDGKMIRPVFVKELQYHGKIIKRYRSEVLQSSVCSRSTLKKVRILLEGVVENGTAKNLRNEQIKIAGKTGTNQIYNKKYGYRTGNEVSYQASFVGYFPADEPRYSCIVVVNSPSKQVYYGNQVAGPVFLEIARKVYATSVDMHDPVEKDDGMMVDLPYSKNGHRDESRTALNELGIPVDKAHIKSPWINTTKDEKTVQFSERTVIENLVPDVVSLGAKDAVYLLENAGLKVVIQGKGSVRRQSLMPGTRVNKGERIILEMTYRD